MKLIPRLLAILLLAQAMVLPAHAEMSVSSAFTAPPKPLHQMQVTPSPEEVQARGRWFEAALLARPLIFDHEDHRFLHGEKTTGNFGVWVPRPINLPPGAALERYRNSERVTIDFILKTLGAGLEKNLTLARMAQLYAFTHNVTLVSGEKMLTRLKTKGFAAAQAYMDGIVRDHDTKAVLHGLQLRRADERKLGAGIMTATLSRCMPNGQPYTLAALRGRYDDFVSSAQAARFRAKATPPRAKAKALTPVRYPRPSRPPRLGGFTPSPA